MPTYASNALGALAFHAPIALATFSAGLQCRIANEGFARLAGRTVDDTIGLTWPDIFPSTLARDVTMLRSVLAGTATAVVVDLPGISPGRRHGDPPGARPPRHKAIAYRVEDATTSVLGLVSWHPARRYVSWNELRDIETSSVATLRRRIWMLNSSDMARNRTLLLAADIGIPTADPRGPSRPGIDLLGLASNLMTSFRAEDSLTLLRQRWPILACVVDSETDVGPLCDRFRTAIQRWSDATTTSWQPFEVRIAVGPCTASPVDLLTRLDAPAHWDEAPRLSPSFAPAFLRNVRPTTT